MSRAARIRRSSRRRGPVLVAALGARWVAPGALGGGGGGRGPDGGGGRRPQAPAAPSLARAVGRKIMTGFAGTAPSRALLARARRGEIGGGVIFGAEVSGRPGGAAAPPPRGAPAGGETPPPRPR